MSISVKICHMLIYLLPIITNTNTYRRNACPDVPKLHLLPGMGWDALTNEDTKQLMELSYNNCELTNDGKYLIPDNTVAVALPVEEMKGIIGELFDHWTNYTSPTASGFKTATGNTTILPLYNSFSDEYQEMKNLQVKHQSPVCRTQLRQLFYRIHAKSNSAMNGFVQERFLSVLHAIYINETNGVGKMVKNIVRDFGTHYSNSIDVGTVMLREDYLNENFYRANENRRGSITSASKLSLLDCTGFSWRDRQYLDTWLLDDYNEAILKKKIRFYGGPNWEGKVRLENMVAIDRSGHLLSNLLTTTNFVHDIGDSILNNMNDELHKAIREYFDRNTHYGCTQPKSKDFDFSKNLDDGSCSPPGSDHVFGGVYEICESFSDKYLPEDVCQPFNSFPPLRPSVTTP